MDNNKHTGWPAAMIPGMHQVVHNGRFWFLRIDGKQVGYGGTRAEINRLSASIKRKAEQARE